MDDNTLFEQRFTAGSRTYYFEVKQASNGNRYLKIIESTRREGKDERQRVFVFDDHAKEFAEILAQAMTYLQSTKQNIL